MFRLELWLVALVAFATAACSAATDERPPPPDAVDAPLVTDTVTPRAATPKACQHGDLEECKVYLSDHNGVTSCFVGVRLCDSGRWGECISEDEMEAELDELARKQNEGGK
jgi:hypothetical protein